MHTEQRIQAFSRLGDYLRRTLDSHDHAAVLPHDLQESIQKAFQLNSWFTPGEVLHALRQWAVLLDEKHLAGWLETYGNRLKKVNRKNIGLVNAGNIPLVGFHDFMTVLLAGHAYQGKNASDDNILLPFLAHKLAELEPEFRSSIHFVPRLKDFDAVIATGSNNSARYFEYYFGKYPHVIRKNRNGIAWLDGKETEAQLVALGEDIFRYFGLGCRNVSHLLLPREFDFSKLFGSLELYADIRNHNKYINNYDYYKAVLILKKIQFYDNGFLILKKDDAVGTPISILNYSVYNSEKEARSMLASNADKIQCIVSHHHLPFGSTQSPALNDYADGVDTMDFLCSL